MLATSGSVLDKFGRGVRIMTKSAEAQLDYFLEGKQSGLFCLGVGGPSVVNMVARRL